MPLVSLLSLLPLLPFTLLFALGVLAQGSGVSVLFLSLPVGLSLTLFILKRNYGAILSLAFAAGFMISEAESPRPLPAGLTARPLSFSGTVVDVRDYTSGRGLLLRLDSVGLSPCRPFLVKAFVPSSLPHVSETDRIRFNSTLEPLADRRVLPDEIDYDAQLRRKGVAASCFIRPDSLRVLFPQPGLLNDIRRRAEDVTLLIARSPLSSSAKEFLNAVLTGDRSMLTPDTRELYSSTGLSHVLALSGLHVGILTWIISLMLFPLWVCGMKRTRVFLIIALLWVFAVFTGLSPSVVRSVVMATLFLLSWLFERVRSPLNSLCAAALLILVFDPSAIYTIGFQLSFLAVGSILVFAEKFNPFDRRRKLWHSIFAYPAVTLAAMLATGMVSAFYFNIFPLYFIPANFVASLLLPFILGFGAVYVGFLAFGVATNFLTGTIDFLIRLLDSTAEFFSGLPGAVASGIYVPPFSLAMWLTAVVALGFFLYGKRRLFAAFALLLAVASFSYAMLSVDDSQATELYIVKEGRHTSLLARSGRSLCLLTSAPKREHELTVEEHEAKYRRYMLKRGIDSISVMSQPMRVGAVTYDGKALTAGGKRFVLIHENKYAEQDSARGADYAVFCAGFRGDIVEAACRLRADTVLLSADINKRRHDRYLTELVEAGIPVITLRQEKFSRNF